MAVVSLGAAQTFAVLGGSTVTNTGPSTIVGDLGVSPGSAVTGFPPGVVSGGTIHANDAVASQAHSDVVIAYGVLAGEVPTTDLTGQDLGALAPLPPGVYHYATSAQLTGILTLDAQGDPNARFDFQIGTTLTTASNSSILLINGAQANNIYFQVGTSATLGTNTAFVGNILADQSITMTTGASLDHGRALTLVGAVTLDTNLDSVPVVLTSVNPTSAPESTNPLTLTVNGTNFVPTSVVQFNGAPLATTFVSTTQLTAIVPAIDLSEEGVAAITVTNPGPGGGPSNPARFTITDPAVQIVGAPASINASPGVDTGMVTLTTFSDPGGSEPIANYSATVNWGDGTPLDSTTPVIVDNGNGTFSVRGHHVYAEPSTPGNPYQITIAICHEDLVVNGGFEQPVVAGVGYVATIPGWTLVSGGAGVFEIQHGVVGPAFEGTQNLELNSLAPSTIAQTVPTIPGQTYQLSFAFAPRPGTPASDNILQVSAGGQVLDTLTADGTGQATFNWQVHTYTITATSPTTTIQFADTATNTDQVGDELDAVSLCVLTTARATANVASQADVGVTKTGPDTVLAGSRFNYTITVTNHGPSSAANVTLTDMLPAGTTFVSQSQSGLNPFTLANSGNAINDTIASLPSGATETFTITVQLPSLQPNGTTVLNSATVGSTTPDPNPLNNTSRVVSTRIITFADLSLTISGTSSVSPGGTVTYFATVTNHGPGDAQRVLFSDQLPTGMHLVSQTQGNGPTFVLSTNITTNAIGDTIAILPAGASQTFVIVAKVNANASNSTRLNNSAAVFAFSYDPTFLDNTSTNTTVVVGGAGAGAALQPVFVPPNQNLVAFPGTKGKGKKAAGY